MIGWLHIALISVLSVLILVLSFLLIFQRLLHPKTRLQCTNLQNGISRLHQVSPICNLDNQVNPICCNLENQVNPICNLDNQVNPICNVDTESSRNVNCEVSPFFSWADHPCLIADAVENGWPRFCFESSSEVEISWEGCEESSDYYVQKVRIKKMMNSCVSVIRTALPLPGPCFGNSFFPQQPYFEITIIELELGQNDCILLTVGLTGGAHLPLKSPGSFPGSIGFNSTASVYLNGTNLVLECAKDEWGRPENVIGCGYNPSHKRVFFTLNSQLVHDIYCKSQEFGHPLYPTVAANTDVTLVLNLGQSPFRFEPANARRTSNPCFVRPPEECYSCIGFEDSEELFSLGRIDPIWKHWADAITNTIQLDQDSLSDLFEIHLGHI